jgi:hypothetical protein
MRRLKEPQASDVGPCIHHFAIEVEDLPRAEQRIKAYSCEIISEPGVIPIKFRAPGGAVAELVPVGRYKPPHSCEMQSSGETLLARNHSGTVSPGLRPAKEARYAVPATGLRRH